MFKKILVSGSFRLISVLCSILASGVLARHLNNADFANFGTANSASVIIGSLLLFGYQLSVVKFLALHGNVLKNESSIYLGNALLMILTLGVACLLIFNAIYLLSVEWIFDDFDINPYGAIAALGLFFVMRSFAVLVGEALRGMGSVGVAATVSGLGTFGGLLPSSSFLLVILSISCFMDEVDLVNIVYIASACYFFAACYGLRRLSNFGIFPRFRARGFLSTIFNEARKNFNLASAQVLQLALGGQAAIVIGSLVGLDATLGNLIIAQQVQAVLNAPLTLINGTIANRIVKLHNDGCLKALEELLRKGATIAFWTTLPAVLVVVVLGKWGLPAIFGMRYTSSYLTVLIISSSVLFNAYTGGVALALALLGLDRVYIKIMSTIAVPGIGACFLAAHFGGTVALSVAVAVLMFIQNVFLVLAVKRHLKVRSVAIVSPRIVYCLIRNLARGR